MASTTLNAISLPQNAQPTVGASLQALWVAGKNLTVALWQVAFGANTVQTSTRFEEAEELRTYAASFQRTDPNFASDLFAAADRHEGL
ncbi:MAG: hypothetical protein Q8O85_12190 [Rhodoferax sp.]|uniref:hypothetical protein n=1 Tax=Rhodoferax sp. TaxID=50421 RepID=UPI0008C97B13|nr:hypothetical protein [Rhodoferax sp.]MDP2679465.1 hypothetical protein [Rhodoferax sp.]OGB59779.1 MAG: hypothetical protein A2503_11000 [Burkholderiales bacterium RIFOXYD12_FULL_59_19]